MNFISTHRQRDGRFDKVAVKLISALHIFQAMPFACNGQIVIFQKVAQARVGRVNVLFYRVAILPRKCCLFRIGKVRGEILGRTEIG